MSQPFATSRAATVGRPPSTTAPTSSPSLRTPAVARSRPSVPGQNRCPVRRRCVDESVVRRRRDAGVGGTEPARGQGSPVGIDDQQAFAVHVVIAVDQALQGTVRAWRPRRPVQRAAGPVPRPVPRFGGPPNSAPEGRRVPRPRASDRTTRTTRTRRPMSGVQPKTEAAHRVERKPGELGPDLPDEEVQRPATGRPPRCPKPRA